MRPGFDVELVDQPVPRSAPTDTSTAFFVGPAEKGPITPQLCTSAKKYTDLFGGRVSFSSVPDAVETFFAEGGSRCYVQRVVGPAAVIATHNFSDVTPAATIGVDALSPGAWGNALSVAVLRVAATFALQVTVGGVIVETSPYFADKASMVAWSTDYSKYIRVRSLAPNTLPVAIGATALTTGADDIVGITNTETLAALDKFSRWFGPGQVAIPGATTLALQTALLAHAAARNRRAVLDAPDSADPSVLQAARDANVADPNARFGAMFGPWDVIPGVVANTKRVVPPCARICGNIARNEAIDGPGQPAAGDSGTALFAIGLTQTYTDAQYEALNDGGVNMSRTLYPGSPIQVYGFRTLVNKDTDPRWVEFSGSRVIMVATSLANAVMAGFAFDQIDGGGHKLAELGGAITGVVTPLYTKGALYGNTPQEAFRVVTDASVNPPEQIQNREVRAVLALKTSPFAEHIVTQIVRRMVTEEV